MFSLMKNDVPNIQINYLWRKEAEQKPNLLLRKRPFIYYVSTCRGGQKMPIFAYVTPVETNKLQRNGWPIRKFNVNQRQYYE